MAADQDTYFDAEVSVFKLNDGSQLQDLSPYVIELRGLPGRFKVNDITTFGSVGERPGPSIFVVHFTIEFLFNMITSVGTHTVLSAMFSNKTLRAFEYYPAGVTAGNAKLYGSACLPVYETTSRAGNQLLTHAEFHADNGITIGVAT